MGNVDVDFVTAVRSMPGGIIRVEELGGAAYAMSLLSPEQGGCFTVTGAGETAVSNPVVDSEPAALYDLFGRSVSVESLAPGVYIVNGKKYIIR